jgi:hypothetical protein
MNDQDLDPVAYLESIRMKLIHDLRRYQEIAEKAQNWRLAAWIAAELLKLAPSLRALRVEQADELDTLSQQPGAARRRKGEHDA